LIQNKKRDEWTFKKQQFKMVIEKEELDLISFFLKKRECRVVLDDQRIQRKIVETYMK